MKKTKLTVFLALALSTVMLLASCAPAAQIPLTDLLLSDESYEPSAPLYTEGDVLKYVDNAEFFGCVGNLAYFRTREMVDSLTDLFFVRHIVYDLKTDKIVFDDINETLKTVNVQLHPAYFEVITTYYEFEGTIGEDIKVTSGYDSEIYDVNGTLLDSKKGPSDAMQLVDLLYFGGKVYRIEEDTISYAFDYSELAKLPSVSARSEKYYYEYNFNLNYSERTVKIYDTELRLVSVYELPSIHSINIENVPVILENGDLLIQYSVEESEDSEEYTYFYTNTGSGSEKKITLVTGVVSAENGTFREIECDYYISSSSQRVEDLNPDAYNGLKLDGFSAIAAAQKIENKRLSGIYGFVFIRNDGTLCELDKLDGEAPVRFSRIAEDRWIIESLSGRRFLVNENGEVVSDVTNAIRCGDFLYSTASKKAYDTSLGVLYDFEANGFDIELRLSDSLLLRDSDGEYYVYNGTGEPKKITSAEDGIFIRDFENSRYTDFAVTVKYGDGTTDYTFYNGAGDVVLTVCVENDGGSLPVLRIITAEYGHLLFSITNGGENTVYYTLH